MVSDSDIQKFRTLIDNKNSVYSDYMKHLLLLASTLFGILVALGPQNSHLCFFSRCIFSAAITCIAGGILSGAASLYAQVKYTRKVQKLWSAELIECLRLGRNAEPVFVEPEKFFERCEKACYVLFCIAMLLLALYSALVVI